MNKVIKRCITEHSVVGHISNQQQRLKKELNKNQISLKYFKQLGDFYKSKL